MLFRSYTDAAFTPIKEDMIFQGESLMTELAAGCVFSCQFCDYASLGKKKYEYMRSYESLEREIVSNYENFGTRVYTFSDNIVNDNPEKLKNLIKIREKTGIDLRWCGFVRIDTIHTKDQVKLLKESGIAAGICGIESLKKEVGPYIGKVTDINRIRKSLEVFRSVIDDYAMLQASFITGLPTETIEDWYNSFSWINSDEGSDFLDVVGFAPLYLHKDNKDKNSINISRNDPFKDYEGADTRWTSPWGTFKEHAELAKKLNNVKKCLTHFSGFNLTHAHNSGVSIEESIRMIRNVKNTPVIMLKMKTLELENRIRERQSVIIQDYKRKMTGEKNV